MRPSELRLVEHGDAVAHVFEGDAEFVSLDSSSVGRSSCSSRALSIAITAWAAKFSSSVICLSGETRTLHGGRSRNMRADKVVLRAGARQQRADALDISTMARTAVAVGVRSASPSDHVRLHGHARSSLMRRKELPGR